MFLFSQLLSVWDLVAEHISMLHPIEAPPTQLCGKHYIPPERERFWDVDYQSQPEVWDVDKEVQDVPNFHISFLEFMTEPEAQRFLALYSVGNLLGSGGCGSVYEGVRRKDGQQVAIKYVPKNDWDLYINLPGETGKLHMEVALMKIVSKPPVCRNVLELLDWFEMSNCLLLVLERPIPCMDVYTLCMKNGGMLDEQLAKIIMLQVLVAAHHCYNRRVFHSDIKPENLLFNPDTLNVKLIDFGCGTLWQDTLYEDFAGTPDFCPPECFLQQEYHAYPATVWSLGILLFSLVCGDVPFKNEEEIIDGALNFTPGLSEACCHLIKWCLEKDPTKRPSLKQLKRHRWFTEGLKELIQVDDRQCSYMAAQRSLDPFTKHADTQQILKTLKEHFALC